MISEVSSLLGEGERLEPIEVSMRNDQGEKSGTVSYRTKPTLIPFTLGQRDISPSPMPRTRDDGSCGNRTPDTTLNNPDRGDYSSHASSQGQRYSIAAGSYWRSIWDKVLRVSEMTIKIGGGKQIQVVAVSVHSPISAPYL